MNTQFRIFFRVLILLTAMVAQPAAQRGGASQPQQLQIQMTDGPTVINGVDLSRLQFRYVGPPGNRVSAVVSPPGDKNVYFAGAASGGVWKSTDGGVVWKPVFDKQKSQSIGALAISPSDHNIVWAGTGESWIRSGISIGDGVYKSTDGGETWTHMGLELTGRVSRIIIHPTNPDIVYVGAVGHGYGPQKERGVYRTKDGGKTWEQTLFVNENTGVSEITMDPTNPNILFAGTWEFVIYTWGKYSGGQGSGVFKSTDGGATWKRLTPAQGLPESPLGKIAVAIAPSNPQRVYALIETGWNGKGSLWRSDDGGEQWKVVNYQHILAERPHYYTRMLVSPKNADEVYFPNNTMVVSMDGGLTARNIQAGGDNHDMWADPTDADRMMIGNDAAVMITTNHGRQWRRVTLPIAQMYHVATDNAVPYGLHGNEQDKSSTRGAGASLGGNITWQRTAGCESGFAIPDPKNPNIIWGTCYAGGVERYDVRTGISRSVDVWPEKFLDAPAIASKYRWNWTHVVYISPHDSDTVYVGSQYLHVTTNGGQSWKIISPDLTTDDKSKQGPSGGLTHDNLGVEECCTIFSIAESPLEKGVLWIGSNDGIVSLSRDGGKTWQKDLTAKTPGFLKWGSINNIEASRHARGTAYISVDGHQVNNRDPYIYKTTDYGKTWKFLGGGIPKSVFSYVRVVREDPKTPGLLYAGTENALYVSHDDGAAWQSLQLNLPHVGVSWIEIQPAYNDLVVATSGRGFWILDDLAPVQKARPEINNAVATLFEPRPTYRLVSRPPGFMNTPIGFGGRGGFGGGESAEEAAAGGAANAGGRGGAGAQAGGGAGQAGADPGAGQGGQGGRGGGGFGGRGDGAPVNPATAGGGTAGEVIRNFPAGAHLQYFLKDAGPVTITITNSEGRFVNKLTANGAAGMNSLRWNLRYAQGPRAVELRTTPETYPQVWQEPRFQGRQTRGIFHYGIGPPQQPLLAGPGLYKVELEAGGGKVTQQLRILADPNLGVPDAEVKEGVDFALLLTDETNLAVDAINNIERIRKQLEDLIKQKGNEPNSANEVAAAKALDKKLKAVEDLLLQPVAHENDPKAYREPMTIYFHYLHLLGQVGNGAGDMAGNPGFKPTDQSKEFHAILKRRLDDALGKLKTLLDNDVAGFNQTTGAQVGVSAKP
jgi:photosystem II stability/assembly factor-like uncharacterized protein